MYEPLPRTASVLCPRWLTEAQGMRFAPGSRQLTGALGPVGAAVPGTREGVVFLKNSVVVDRFQRCTVVFSLCY